jgi:hypothetical protein
MTWRDYVCNECHHKKRAGKLFNALKNFRTRSEQCPNCAHPMELLLYLDFGLDVGRTTCKAIPNALRQFASSTRDQRLRAREDFMKKSTNHRNSDDIRPEYDFGSMKGVRGKYYEQYRKGTNVVLLDPDIAEAFPTESAVNEALRGILSTTRAVRRTGGPANRPLQSTSRRNKGRTRR